MAAILFLSIAGLLALVCYIPFERRLDKALKIPVQVEVYDKKKKRVN